MRKTKTKPQPRPQPKQEPSLIGLLIQCELAYPGLKAEDIPRGWWGIRWARA